MEVTTRPIPSELKEFAEKYEIAFGRIWNNNIPDEYIVKFYELIKIREECRNLIGNYYEDFVYYAIMYRNVSKPYNLYDYAFFVSHKDEIIGFKKKILSFTDPDRASIVKSYYTYGPYFELLYKKLLKRDIPANNDMEEKCTLEMYNNIDDGKFGHVFSINDITVEDCETLINHLDELRDM